MRVKVLLFAAAREAAGSDELELELPEGSRLADLKAVLEARYPGLKGLPFVFAVGEEYAGPEHGLADGDEVAVVPPISGGGEPAAFDFVEGELPWRELVEACRSDEDGAVVVFLGVTRRDEDGVGLRALAYEAYERMARRSMERILAEACRAHGPVRLLVRHRLGEVPPGEASVAVVAAAPHRAAAFAAAAEVMDRIKAEVPIFKKAVSTSGDHDRWLGDLPRGTPRQDAP